MSLRIKTLVILTLAFVCLVGSYYAFTQIVLTRGFDQLENHFVGQYVYQAADYFEIELERLATLTEDWASWDEIYGYMESRDPEFLNSNLTDDVLLGLNLSFVLIQDPAGNPVYLSGIDRQTGQRYPISEATVGPAFRSALSSTPESAYRLSGLLHHDGQPAIIARYPILNSGGNSPPRGWLLFGRYLDEAEIRRISVALDIPLVLYELTDTALPATVTAAFFTADEGQEFFTEPVDAFTIAGYLMLKDILGAPSVILRADMPRDIYQQAKDNFTYTTLLFVIIGLATIMGTMRFLDSNVLARISRLVRNVVDIGKAGDISKRLPVLGHDEISRLGRNINGMLENLETVNRARDKSQAALLRSEEHFRSVSDTAQEAILTFNPDGHIFYLNQSTRRLFNCVDSEILGEPIHLLFQTSQKAELQRLVRDAQHRMDKTDTSARQIELAAVRRDGSSFPAEVSMAGWNTQTEQRFTIMVRDTTERHQAQRELERQNLELQQANTAKSDFLAQMSHELRTPLNAIMGFTELMSDRILGDITTEQDSCLNDIHTSGQHLLNLIDDVLDVGKIEAGKTEVKQELLVIDAVVADVVGETRPMLDKARQTVTVEIADEVTEVTTDRKLLRQILFNLLSNASKFSPAESEIKITAHREGDHYRISVADRGIGVKEDQLERVFEAFYQADTLNDRAKEGTGLGLNICRQYVTLMGGKIWVESTFGQGATFTFTFPV